jgi:ribosomal protein L37AE/L43A
MNTLPRPTNRQSAKLLQRMCNRLALAPTRTLRHIHTGLFTCTFCGQPIAGGDTYRDKGYAARAHDLCFRAVAREDWGSK